MLTPRIALCAGKQWTVQIDIRYVHVLSRNNRLFDLLIRNNIIQYVNNYPKTSVYFGQNYQTNFVVPQQRRYLSLSGPRGAKSTGTSQPKAKPKKLSGNIDVKTIMDGSDEWIHVGDHRIHAWSISGLESCIVAKIDNINLAFDMGYATRPSIKCPDVFISHGHIDHIASLLKHAAHRSLFSLKPATYHIPSHLVASVQKMAEAIGELHGPEQNFADLHIKSIDPGDTVELPGGVQVLAFPTYHRVPSQGYLVYRNKKRLKAEYADFTGPEIGNLVKQGHEVSEFVKVPELAYTGDTTFEVFSSTPIEDLLKVKTLITEATYIDDEEDKQGRRGIERARMRGHIHLQEIIDREELFKCVKNIVLVHFSDKYPIRYLRRKTDQLIPDTLKQKISFGILMKEKLG